MKKLVMYELYSVNTIFLLKFCIDLKNEFGSE
jgi:hypothetical protein